mmetsp:Transcript_10694/g.16770  ORF Transcript_10694/g.16770 Transcript_10694/m.16770 type:complete len:140 (+) Transcript_10694:290-709(+)
MLSERARMKLTQGHSARSPLVFAVLFLVLLTDVLGNSAFSSPRAWMQTPGKLQVCPVAEARSGHRFGVLKLQSKDEFLTTAAQLAGNLVPVVTIGGFFFTEVRSVKEAVKETVKDLKTELSAADDGIQNNLKELKSDMR